jgi:hypothetical protein
VCVQTVARVHLTIRTTQESKAGWCRVLFLGVHESPGTSLVWFERRTRVGSCWAWFERRTGTKGITGIKVSSIWNVHIRNHRVTLELVRTTYTRNHRGHAKFYEGVRCYAIIGTMPGYIIISKITNLRGDAVLCIEICPVSQLSPGCFCLISAFHFKRWSDVLGRACLFTLKIQKILFVSVLVSGKIFLTIFLASFE